MKKTRRQKKKDGIATAVITIVLVIFALANIPAFKNLTNTNAQVTKNVSNNLVNVTK